MEIKILSLKLEKSKASSFASRIFSLLVNPFLMPENTKLLILRFSIMVLSLFKSFKDFILNTLRISSLLSKEQFKGLWCLCFRHSSNYPGPKKVTKIERTITKVTDNSMGRGARYRPIIGVFRYGWQLLKEITRFPQSPFCLSSRVLAVIESHSSGEYCLVLPLTDHQTQKSPKVISLRHGGLKGFFNTGFNQLNFCTISQLDEVYNNS